MWMLPPRLPGEQDNECAYWLLKRVLALPGPEEDPRLLPWEAQALNEWLRDQGHRGRLIIEGMPLRPLEGYDVVGASHEYRGAGGREIVWLAGPASEPHVPVPDYREPGPTSPPVLPWALCMDPPRRPLRAGGVAFWEERESYRRLALRGSALGYLRLGGTPVWLEPTSSSGWRGRGGERRSCIGQ